MTKEPATLAGLAHDGVAPLDDYSAAPNRIGEIADYPLKLPDFKKAKTHLLSSGHYDEQTVDDLITSIVLGNVILAGPPGTGKTTLARALAEAFNASMKVETANPEWSVFDTIGTQTLTENGGVKGRHGLVTEAVIQCANTIVAHADNNDGNHAHWLLIDEMNRAEIDRAFGPLFTALSGGSDRAMVLDYLEGRPTVVIPDNFRIIATVNEFDARFVQSMSAALRRRFAKVVVLPPANELDGSIPLKELDAVLSQCKISLQKLAPAAAPSVDQLEAPQRLTLRKIFGFFRASGNEGGVPLGTAALIDTLAFAIAFAHASELDLKDNFDEIIDRALSARLVPSLETDSARLRIGENFPEALRASFPFLKNTSARISAFLKGAD